MTNKTSHNIVEIDDLKVVRNGRVICALPRLSIRRGQRIALVGPNGTGKTTLLRVLAGLERDFQGRCDMRAALKQRVYVHQHPFLFRGSVLENVVYGLRARGLRAARRKEMAMHWLERLGIDHLAGRPARWLSGGERRRAALARAFVIEPELLLLDEPLAEMDEDGARRVITAAQELPSVTMVATSPTGLPDSFVECVIEIDSALSPACPAPSSQTDSPRQRAFPPVQSARSGHVERR